MKLPEYIHRIEIFRDAVGVWHCSANYAEKYETACISAEAVRKAILVIKQQEKGK